MNVFNLACNIPWLITSDGLKLILQIASRESLDPELAAQLRADRAERPSAVAARRGRPLDGARHAWVRDGVAVIDITGPIVRYADFFSEVSGAASVETLALDFQRALDDPAVDAILLNIDSPGGEVTGIHDFGEQIHAARGIKPVWAFVEGLGASAAYWLASATQHIVADPTAALGSIGVVMSVRDPSKAKATDIEIVSSQSPNKRPDVLTERGRSQYQRLVDDLASVFIETMARNRAVSEETVITKFGEGGVLIGKYAVQAGLADQLGGFEETLAALAAHAAEQRPLRQRRASASTESEPNMNWREFWSGFFKSLPSAALDPAVVSVQGSLTPAALLQMEAVSAPLIRITADGTGAPVAEPASTDPAPVEPTTAPAAPATEPAAEPASEPAPAEPAAPAEPSDPQAAVLAELAATRAEVAALKAEQRTQRYQQLAAGWYGAHADHLLVLQALTEGSPAWEAYGRIQNASAATIKQGGLFVVQGADTAPVSNADAWGQIEARAKALKAQQPTLSIEQAIAKVVEENPDLYAAYRAER